MNNTTLLNALIGLTSQYSPRLYEVNFCDLTEYMEPQDMALIKNHMEGRFFGNSWLFIDGNPIRDHFTFPALLERFYFQFSILVLPINWPHLMKSTNNYVVNYCARTK